MSNYWNTLSPIHSLLTKRESHATGGRAGFGKCTPITKKGCTGRAKALAKTFKKMAKKRKAA